jgi:hypothetical protein
MQGSITLQAQTLRLAESLCPIVILTRVHKFRIVELTGLPKKPPLETREPATLP